MTCPYCSATILSISNFCSECGKQVAYQKYCYHCGMPYTVGINFCGHCGTNLHIVIQTLNDIAQGPQIPAVFQTNDTSITAQKEQTAEIPQAQKTIPKPITQTSEVAIKTHVNLQQKDITQAETAPVKSADDPSSSSQIGFSDEFAKFMPKHIVDQILHKSSLQEEMKNVAVMFADVSGFTAMSENMDPEEVTNIMNKCFQLLVDLVNKYEGTVNKFIGDCVMTIFGAPIAHENDSERAVRCALDMIKSIEAFNKTTNINVPIGISIGINAGKVFAGIVGSAMRKEYTVMGDTVNLAQRLESIATKGRIIVGQNVYKATKDLFEYIDLEPVAVKGKKEKVQSYEVVSEKKSESGKAVEYGWTLVNRTQELQKFDHILEKFEKPIGQILYVSGEAGIGKSRIMKELTGIFAKRYPDSYVIKCHAASHTTELTYYIFQNFIRILCNITNDDSENVMKEKIKTLQKYTLDMNEIHFIGLILYLKYEDSNVQFFDEAKKKLSIFLAIKKLIAHLTQEKPLAFVLDNLQWIDLLSKELLDFIIEDIRNNHIILFLCSRFDYSKVIEEDDSINVLTLTPFNKEETYNLIEEILGAKDLPETLKEAVWSRSIGNPLFTEEIIKSFVDDKKIVKNAEGKWLIDQKINLSEIPHTIHGIIASRVDRLDEKTKILLQHLSVIGREFRYSIAKEVMKDFPSLNDELIKLAHKQMIFEKAKSPDTVYIFKSLLLVEVSYGSILKKKLKEFHEKVGNAIEKINADRLEEHYELLAHHFSKTDCYEKAINYLEKSAEKLASECQLEGANNYYRTAIEFIKRALENNVIDVKIGKEKQMNNLYRSIDIALKQGDLDYSEKSCGDLLTLAEANKDKTFSSKAKIGLGRFHFFKGNFDDSINYLKEALHITQEEGLDEISSKTMGFLGDIYERKGESDLSIVTLEEGIKIAEKINNQRLLGELNKRIGTSYLFKGTYDKALDYYNKAIDYAKQVNDKTTMSGILGNIGIVYSFQKDFNQCLDYYNKALELCREIGDKIGISRNLHNIGEVYYENQKYKEALKNFQESLPVSEETGWREGYANNLIYVGFLKFLQNENATEGKEMLHKGIEISEKYNFNRAIPMGRYLLGKINIEEKNIDEAKQEFDKAMKIANSTGFKKLIDDINVELKKLAA